MYFSKKMWIYNSIPFYSVQIFWSQDYIFSKSCIWTKNFWPQSLLSTKVEPNVSSAWGHEARKLRVILTKLVRQHSWRQQTVNSHLSSDTDFPGEILIINKQSSTTKFSFILRVYYSSKFIREGIYNYYAQEMYIVQCTYQVYVTG